MSVHSIYFHVERRKKNLSGIHLLSDATDSLPVPPHIHVSRDTFPIGLHVFPAKTQMSLRF